MPPGHHPASARALLEQVCSGHSPHVEVILRFADDHNLGKDDLVFLLASILKANESIVSLLLDAIKKSNAAMTAADARAADIQRLGQQVVAQVEFAANRAAGQLAAASNVVNGALQTAEKYSGFLVRTVKALQSTETSIRELMTVPEPIDVRAAIEMQAQDEARNFLTRSGYQTLNRAWAQYRSEMRWRSALLMIAALLACGLAFWLGRR